MSAARQLEMAAIKQQIAEVELLKATGGVYPATPQGKLQQQQDIYKGQLGVVKAEDEYAKAERDVFRDSLAKAKNGINNGKRRLSNGAYGLNRQLANIPTPGGVWVPFWILMFLFFVLFPVNGHTRAMWIYLVLTGNAAIDPTPTRSTEGPVGGGGNFGQTTQQAPAQIGTASPYKNATQSPLVQLPSTLPSDVQHTAGGRANEPVRSYADSLMPTGDYSF